LTRLTAGLFSLLLVAHTSFADTARAQRTLNVSDLRSLIPKGSFGYDTAVLDYELTAPNGNTIHLNSCTQVDATKDDDVAAFDYKRLQYVRINCLALKRYSTSTMPKKNFFPPRLTRAFIASLPATAAFLIGDSEYIRQLHGKSLAASLHGLHLHISILSKNEAKVVTDEDDDRYVVVARADFDGDGIEDLLMRIDWRARDAFGAASDLVLLSKKSASGPVSVSWRAPEP